MHDSILYFDYLHILGSGCPQGRGRGHNLGFGGGSHQIASTVSEVKFDTHVHIASPQTAILVASEAMAAGGAHMASVVMSGLRIELSDLHYFR